MGVRDLRRSKAIRLGGPDVLRLPRDKNRFPKTHPSDAPCRVQQHRISLLPYPQDAGTGPKQRLGLHLDRPDFFLAWLEDGGECADARNACACVHQRTLRPAGVRT